MLATVDYLLLGDLIDNLGRYAINTLAVAGGFFVGYLLTGWGLAFTNRFVVKRKKPIPKPLMTTSRVLGGFIVAILVAMIVFSDSFGFGLGGGGFRPGGDSREKSEESKQLHHEPKQEPTPKFEQKVPVKGLEPVPMTEFALRIVLLGGDRVRAERIFQIENELTTYTLESLKTAIDDRLKADAGKPIHTLEILVYPQSLPRTLTPEVAALEDWARERSLSVKFPAVTGDLP